MGVSSAPVGEFDLGNLAAALRAEAALGALVALGVDRVRQACSAASRAPNADTVACA